jgi:hypothetical protein
MSLETLTLAVVIILKHWHYETHNSSHECGMHISEHSAVPQAGFPASGPPA